jgi:hypothetical protein
MLQLIDHWEKTMRLQVFASTLAALTASGFALAQATKADQDHSAHHPPSSPPAAAAPAPKKPTTPDAFDKQMKTMQDMHQRMQSARTPAERAALMDEHMKLMQSGMAMMGQMQGKGGTSSQGGMGMMPPQNAASGAKPGAPGVQGMGGRMGMHQQMERRMTMMEQMMQMMVDREAAMPRK